MSGKQTKRTHASIDRQSEKVIDMFLHEACSDSWWGRRKLARQIMRKKFLVKDPKNTRLFKRMFNHLKKGKEGKEAIEDNLRNEGINKRDDVLKEAAYTAEYLGVELELRDKHSRKAKAFKLDKDEWVAKARSSAKTRMVIEKNQMEEAKKKKNS